MRGQAIWSDTMATASDQTIVVEGNHYFPEEPLHPEYLTPSTSVSICPWKGKASYYHLTVGEQVNHDAALQYRRPIPLARRVKNLEAVR